MPHRKTPRPVPFKVGRAVGRGVRGYEDNTIPLPTPDGPAILTEAGLDILTEDSVAIFTEDTF